MAENAVRRLNPLPQRFLTDGPGINGVLKQRPEDFLVEEQALYEPCGEGEHLYLFIEKVGMPHGEMIARIRKHFHVPEKAIGFAGMKDKIGITRQLVSVHTPDDDKTDAFGDDRCRVLWAARHRNRLRRGHLKSNRFSIRIREIDPFKVVEARRTLEYLCRHGVPNYFGYQRFGYRTNNHILGAAVVRRDWQALLDELLGTQGSSYPEHQQERRELYDAGRYAEAAALWRPADQAELRAIRALSQNDDRNRAARSVGKTALGFWGSALQSAVFNKVLDKRLEDGTVLDLFVEELAYKHDSRAVFRVTAEDLANGSLADRLARLEISPSGPLWGRGMIRAEGEVGRIEETALATAGLAPDDFKHTKRLVLDGVRRSLRVPVVDPAIESGIDEHGGYVRVAFDLPRGAYATVVLREIMKTAD